jgi:hypothetical protein
MTSSVTRCRTDMLARVTRSLLCAVGLVLAGTRSVLGSDIVWTEEVLDIEPAPAGLATAKFRLALPSTVSQQQQRIRGLIGVSNHEGGASVYTHPDWRKLAADERFGVLMYELRAPPVEADLKRGAPASRRLTTGSPDAARAIETALATFADRLSRPELKHAPLLPTGLSRGARQAAQFSHEMPGRIIAFVAIHGMPEPGVGTFIDLAGSEPARRTPGLATLAADDHLIKDSALLRVIDGRRRQAVWTVAIEPGVPHHKIGDQTFPVLWARRVIAMRLGDDAVAGDGKVVLNELSPDTGFVGIVRIERRDEQGRLKAGVPRVMPADQYTGAPEEAVWLPDADVAAAWVEFCSGRPVTSRPSGPP